MALTNLLETKNAVVRVNRPGYASVLRRRF